MCAVAVAPLLGGAVDAFAARSLVVYCSHDPDACELTAQTFTRDTGISAAITRKPTGEFYAHIEPVFTRWDAAKFPVGPSGTESKSGYWPNWLVVPKGTDHAAEDHADTADAIEDHH